MTMTTALLKTPRILSLAREGENFPRLTLRWRRRLLLIKAADPNTTAEIDSQEKGQTLPALQNLKWSESCLKLSPVKAVRLEMDLGETAVRQWAEVCASTGKRVFVHLPAAACLPKRRAPFSWIIKRMADWIVAIALLIVLSPLMLLIGGLVLLTSPGSIFFKQWRVGHRGELFKILKFRTMRADAEQLHHQLMGDQSGMHKLENDPRVTTIGRWLRKYSLDELPQLLNVLRGDMSLVGPRPLALYDAIRLSSTARERLNALPGMTGFWQVSARSHKRDLEAVSQIDLDYLEKWSLRTDFHLLLLTIPKVLKGFGAF
jgi:lipopolysaccharide/colanic/teichoic acid biosynthesis glycosyltransferase